MSARLDQSIGHLVVVTFRDSSSLHGWHSGLPPAPTLDTTVAGFLARVTPDTLTLLFGVAANANSLCRTEIPREAVTHVRLFPADDPRLEEARDFMGRILAF